MPFVCPPAFNSQSAEWNKMKRRKIVTVPPQSMIVIGGGPTGLITTLHCLENVIFSDGNMRLYESRDAFSKYGLQFERSQIVRLDPRWIVMLRYHLGHTLFFHVVSVIYRWTVLLNLCLLLFVC
jgi:hypothetical protein